ncbi:hypothetical protein [Chryseobacterium sp. BIGb0232]|uniref:hypothetical protein n=1 Tax=Chryseobacterium sp. BIGb0232 TaxID=2940598 RepID=UPI0011CD7535|nr:hypothetical protein [Chryseobacterium sp. BIGb0232]MCS4301064.1 hypothetical protein [Chryseobacterium sp. BIGb0232]
MKKKIPSVIKTKHYILGKILIIILLVFVSCKENKSKTDDNIMVHTETIQSVKMISAGGGLGFSSSTLIDKDSIHYRRTVAANEAENLTYSRDVKPEDWKKLVATIDQKLFRAVKEGKSVQPVDGIDTKIIVTTSAGDISKMNAYDDPAWKSIRDIIDHYNELYR